MKTAEEDRKELIRCPACDVYIRREEGFVCPRCKRSSLCKSHRVPGRRECASCVVDLQNRELIALRQQEQSIRSFLRLLQFLFIVFAILFIALRTGVAEVLEFLRDSVITAGFGYMGVLSVVGYVVFYFLLFSQRQKIREAETAMKKAEFRRMVK